MRTILYLPGLGSEKSLKIQRWYLKLRTKNQKLVFFEPKWHSDESYKNKWKRLTKIISQLDPHSIHVVGVSAGGSLLVRVMSEYEEIKSATCISGKVTNSAGIGQDYRKSAPALFDSVLASENTIKTDNTHTKKITIFRPFFDNVVPLQDMLVPGAKTKRIFAFGHASGIAIALIFKFPKPKLI